MGQDSNRQMEVSPSSWDDMSSLIANAQVDEHGFTVQPVTGGPSPRRIGGSTAAITNADQGQGPFSGPNKLSRPLDNTDMNREDPTHLAAAPLMNLPNYGGRDSRAGRSVHEHDSVRDERSKLPVDYSGDGADQDPSQLVPENSGESTKPDDLDDLEALWDMADQDKSGDIGDEDALGDIDNEEWDSSYSKFPDDQQGTSGSSAQVYPTPSQIARIAHPLPLHQPLNRGPSYRRKLRGDPTRAVNRKRWRAAQKPGWREHNMCSGPTMLRQIWLPGMIADPESEALMLKKPAWMLWP